MYVKVRKNGNQWFREDIGTLVGTELNRSTEYYKKIANLIGNQIIIRDKNNEIRQIYYGYFYNNKFIHLNILKKCSDKTCGYYAFILD